MSPWPSWPLLVRPVWYLFDRVGDDQDRGGGIPRQSPGAVAGVARRWGLPARLDRDPPGDAFLILAFYVGPYLAWALLPRTLGFLYYYLPAATGREPRAGLCAARGNSAALVVMGICRVGAAGFAAMLPISAAFVETSMATFNRLMIFQNWI